MTRQMSLGWELAELQQAIEAARILAEQIARDHLQDDYSAQQAPVAVASVLALVGARVKDLGRVLRGELDPAGMFAHHNDKPPLDEDDGPDPDVYLGAWGLHQIRAELRRMEGRIRRERKERDERDEDES